MRTHLMVIDPQNDFCDLPDFLLSFSNKPALAVPGANADMQRLGHFIVAQGSRINDITVTLDSHPSVAVERVSFWTVGEDGTMEPFTQVSAADVRSAKYLPRDRSKTQAVISMLDQLAAAGSASMTVWPVHCVTGTWGHNIHAVLASILADWEYTTQSAVRKVLKGEHPMTEHFGVFQADAPIEDVASTQFNTELAERVTDTDILLIAGQASSHCVASSVDQLVSFLGRSLNEPRIILLADCMSPVPGFEGQADAFMARAAKFGINLMKADDVSGWMDSMQN